MPLGAARFGLGGVDLGKLELIQTQTVTGVSAVNFTSIEQATNFETREYALNLRYYFKADTSQELVNKAVKGKIDRLRKHLLDNQVDTSNNWAALIVDTINYNVQDEENEEESNLHIAEYEITIQHFNHFT